MTTERDIIYTIWDVIRGGETNADDPINERLLRQFLRTHRGKHLDRAFDKGMTITDEPFQILPQVNFERVGQNFVSSVIPKTIRLKDNAGVRVYLDDYEVSLVGIEEWRNSQKTKFGKYHPLLKFVKNQLHLYIGQEQDCQLDDFTNSSLNRAVRKIREQLKFNKIELDVHAILVNTDDEPGYDWTKDSYPMPDDLIEDIINSVNIKEFNVFLQMRSDETGDMRFNVSEKNTREEL